MRAHRAALPTQREGCALLARLTAEDDVEGEGRSKGGRGGKGGRQGGGQGGFLLEALTSESQSQRRVRAAGAAALVASALKARAATLPHSRTHLTSPPACVPIW